MYKLKKLKSGLTLITVPIPSLESVTTLVAVGAGSRYETKRINGISHFLEHMFFKGSKKYPTAEIIANLVDGIGAVNNAATSKEWTYYWIKSSSKHIEIATDVVASMLKDSMMVDEEIQKEKGVIIEEIRMRRDNPQIAVWDLFEMLQLGEQPLGYDTAGEEKIINSLTRKDFVKYVDSLYAPENMVLVYAGNLPKNIEEIAEKYFADLPKRAKGKYLPYKKPRQRSPKIGIMYKKSDQANLVLGTFGYDRYDKKRYPAKVLATILGAGMSSRLFIQVREKRGLAYTVMADHDPYIDTGIFAIYAGLKLEKTKEGLEVIKTEIERTVSEKVTAEELKKAKEMIRGRVALRSESTNFLAEHFGTNFILDRELESFDEYLKHIDAVTAEDVQSVAGEMFKSTNYNLQVIGPFKNTSIFEKILSNGTIRSS